MAMLRFLAIVVLGVLALAACGPTFGGATGRVVTPSDVVVTEERQVSGFDALSFEGLGQVTITQGDSESLSITGPENVLPLIETAVEGSTLRVWMTGRVRLESDVRLVFTLTVRDLTALTNSGAGEFLIGPLETPELSVTNSGAGSVAIEQISTQRLTVTNSGAGETTVAGTAADLMVSNNGLGGFAGAELRSQRATVDISGMGGATVWASERLAVTISGAGQVEYYGSPQVSQNISGAGSVRGLGAK
jgi:Putative auto-transporter adhesin, head GIN domain